MFKHSLKKFVILFLVAGFTSWVFAESQVMQKRIDKKVEKERIKFKELLTQNPNYFGNVKVEAIAEEYPVVSKMSMNTKYEELTCVGLYPEDNILEAIIEVKLPYGFKGSLCGAGSKEYLGFYLDYNDGSGFVSVGAPTEVNVHNISFVNGGHLFYAVRKPFIPLKYTECETPQIVQLRAILSWEDIPTGPGFTPVWGNVVDVWVQIRPKRKGSVKTAVTVYKYTPYELFEPAMPLPKQKIEPIGPIPPVEKYIITGGKEEIEEFITRSIETEKRIKKEGKVEVERLEYSNLIHKNPNYFGSIINSTNPAEIKEAVYQLPSPTVEYLLPKLVIDPDLLTPVKPLLMNTSYEELKCVGLYPEDDLLEAIIEVKRPYGFNGDLCNLGSTEYVAFYIDWGTGLYQHEATATVGVYDIPAVNGKHLFYAVKARIPNIGSRLQNCAVENVVKVKAILSWSVDPTPFGDIYSPTWGNVLVRNVQIRPLDGASVICNLEIVNEIHTDDISQSGVTEGLAVKVDASNNTVPAVHDRPFGGIIACRGNINVPGAAYYRFRYSDDNGTSWKNITDRRTARNIWGFTITRSPINSEGWFSKSEYETDMSNYSLTALVHWNSSGKNGNYQLRLELADAGENPLPGQTCDVSILLDNVRPELFAFGGTPSPLPAQGVTVKDTGGNYRKCDTFNGAELIKIFGNFRDDYFKHFRLKVFGGNIAPSGEVIGSGRYDSGLPGINGQGIVGAFNGSIGEEIGSLNLCTVPQSAGKVRCAYGIELALCDRAIRGYVSGYVFNTSHHWRDAFVTFDWDPAGCP